MKSEGAKAAAGVKGRRISRYVLAEKLATGGMAEIYLARHETSSGFSKELVLKLLQGRFADDETVRSMFLEEARLGAKLSHPAIVDVYDAGEENGAYFIAMEYIRGKTLTEVMLRAIELGRPLPLRFAALVVSQVADGLAYLQQGIDLEGRPLEILHRDISPMNLVVAVAGQTKIIDFGIAKQGTRIREETGVRPGKLSYMSPEQVKGQPLDGRSDIFSLGTILYEITVGRRLWRGAPEVVMRRIVEETPTPPTYLVRDYPPALELVVQKALEKRPEARYASGAEMCEELEAFLHEQEAGVGRAGNRQLARYLHELFAPGAQTSERGLRRAQAFMDDEREPGADEDDIDFDKEPAAGAGAAFAHALRASAARLPELRDEGAAPPSTAERQAAAAAPSPRVAAVPTAPENAGEAPTLAASSGGAMPQVSDALGGRKTWLLLLVVLIACGAVALVLALLVS